jgi:hypothetical protein
MDEPRKRQSGVLAGVIGALILLPILVHAFGLAPTTPVEAGVPFLEMPDPRYTECLKREGMIESTEDMRFHHWQLLREVREEVVRSGRRGDLGLKRCSECHVSRVRFCDRCHEAATVRPDCWGCHYYP